MEDRWEHVGRVGDVRATGVSFHLEDRALAGTDGCDSGSPSKARCCSLQMTSLLKENTRRLSGPQGGEDSGGLKGSRAQASLGSRKGEEPQALLVCVCVGGE